MSTSYSRCRPDSTVIAVVASLIIGIITAFLRITAAITLTPAFLWVLLGIAVVYLAVTLIASAVSRHNCSCENSCRILTALLIGILGTILFSVVLLAIEFVATSIPGAVITGALLFFFSLTVTFSANLASCLFNCDE